MDKQERSALNERTEWSGAKKTDSRQDAWVLVGLRSRAGTAFDAIQLFAMARSLRQLAQQRRRLESRSGRSESRSPVQIGFFVPM